MTDRLAVRHELWKQWRVADTRLHRIAALSLRRTPLAAADDVARRSAAHAMLARRRALLLKRLALIGEGGMSRCLDRAVARPASEDRHRTDRPVISEVVTPISHGAALAHAVVHP